MLATGDDDGVIKVCTQSKKVGCGLNSFTLQQLWDPRKPDVLREYRHHFDFISDFLWLEDKRQLIATR
jgi:hypothetical protein